MKDHKGNGNSIIIFSDNLANFERNAIVKINNSIQSGWVRFQNLPGATPRELLYYMDPTLADGNYDRAIVYVGINDISHDDSLTKVENLVWILKKIAIKLKNMELKTYDYLG